MNAELLRNAWLELTPSRLLLAPIVLGAIFLVVWYVSERDVGAVASAAGSIYFVIALVWGSRRAANALAYEVTGSTWDSQRMTALGPWSMTWGKFVGGTAYVWYAALIALAVSVALDPFSHDATERFFLAVGSICIGLSAMLAAFFVVLLNLRRPRGPGRRISFLAQAVGVVVGLMGWASNAQLIAAVHTWSTSIVWYRWSVSPDWVVLVTQLSVTVWLGFGVYRAMCGELQKPTWPWGWPLASAYALVYAAGFVLPMGPNGSWALALLPLAILAVLFFYGALLGDAKDGVKLRWFFRSIGSGDVSRAARLFPSWLFSFVLASVLVLIVAVLASGDRPGAVAEAYGELSDAAFEAPPAFLAWGGAIVLFMLRDMLLVLYLNISTKARSPDMAAIVLLGMSYVVLPLLLGFVAPGWTLAFVTPWPFAHPLVALFGPVATLVPIAILLAQRWHSLAPRVGAPLGQPA